LRKISNPRLFSLIILSHFDQGKIVLDSLGQSIASSKLNPQDKRLAYELTAGAIRRKGTLDTLIGIYSSRKIGSLDRFVVNSLRIGYYQLRYMKKIPRFAAVDESVKLVKTELGAKTGGFVNAVLRSYIRNPEKVDQKIEQLSHYEKLAFEFSHPEWIIKRWLQHIDLEKIKNFCGFNNFVPSVVIRVNTALISVEKFKELFDEAGVGFTDSPVHKDCLRLSHGKKVEELPGFYDGFFTVQDETPVLIMDKLEINENDKVLDLCAAPGGKSFYAAFKTGKKGTVVAVDINAGRLKKLEEQANRLHIQNIKTIAVDGTDKKKLAEKLGKEKFHKIIVDVPCSNTGVLRRRAEARWRLKEDDFNRLAVIQRTLLENSGFYLAPGGKLLYSTCSIDPVENEENINKFLNNNPGFELSEKILFLPQNQHDSDGGFGAVFTKFD